MKNPKLLLILRLAVSLFLLLLLFWLAREHLGKIGELLKNVNLGYYVLGLLFFVLTIVILCWRLQILLSVQGCNVFSFQDIFSLNLIGYFFTNFMPTSIGGDLVKGFFIAQKINNKTLAYATIFIDRVVGTLSLALIAASALVATHKEIEYPFIFWAVGFLLFISLVVITFLLNKRLSQQISNRFGLKHLLRILKIDALAKKAYEAMHIYAHYKRQMLMAFLISLAAHFITFTSVLFLALSLGAHTPYVKILLAVPVISILCMLPITLNGLGLREWAFVFFFRTDIGEPAALSLSLLLLSLFLLVSVFGGIVYLLKKA
ncbi:MAG: lysylphosphatidylglycerol synthase transmembrane domain-containing protein [Candidatus Omnitrophota bacterium]